MVVDKEKYLGEGRRCLLWVYKGHCLSFDQLFLHHSHLRLINLEEIGPDHVQVNWKHKSICNLSQCETRPLIGSIMSANHRPSFQLTYASS